MQPTDGFEQGREIQKMRLLIRRRITTLAIVVLAILAGSEATRAQNNERLNKAANSTMRDLLAWTKSENE